MKLEDYKFTPMPELNKCICKERVDFFLGIATEHATDYRWKCARHGICNFLIKRKKWP